MTCTSDDAPTRASVPQSENPRPRAPGFLAASPSHAREPALLGARPRIGAAPMDRSDDVPRRFAVDLAGATLLGTYRVERRIADGGMGSVWLAEDTNLGRRVVVKVPHVRFLGEPGFRARFAREIAGLVRLEHPHIVRILAQGTHEEVPFLVLQYLGGGSLEQRLAGARPRGAADVAPWLATIAATLDFVHGRGVVHRDIKPENILFDEDGNIFLSDFGIAKALDEDRDVTEDGTGVGSPKYMAPEQGRGGPITGAADQYGLATVVYEAIAGRLPFAGDAALEILVRKQTDPPASISDFAPDLPAAGAAALMRALAPEPADRFDTCRAFAEAFLAGAGAPAAAPGTVAPRRRRGVSVVIVAVLVVAAALVASRFGADRAGDVPDRGPFDVVLLSAGEAPRRPLRYRFAPGREEVMRTRVVTDETKRLADRPAESSGPLAILIRTKTSIRDVAPDGDASFAWQSLEVAFEPATDAPAATRDALRLLLEGLAGRSGSGGYSARGIRREIRHDAPPDEDAAARKLYDLITAFLEEAPAPLPAEPVGVGARWEVTTAKEHLEGIRITQTVTYELASLDADGATLRLFIAVAALDQPVAAEDASGVRLKRVHGDGTGSMRIDFDHLVPRDAAFTVTSRAEMTVPGAPAEQDLAVEREVRVATRRE